MTSVPFDFGAIPTQAQLTFKGSKTNQFGRTEIRKVDCRCTGLDQDRNEVTCPVHALLRVVKDRTGFTAQQFNHSSINEAAFIQPGGAPFSYKDVREILKDLAIRFELDPHRYTAFITNWRSY